MRLALCPFLALAPGAAAQDNVLVLLADDLGVDYLEAYGEHPFAWPTPNIDQLAATGVVFRNAWVNPNCSSSRATLLTGRHPSRHRVGSVIPRSAPAGLSGDEVTIAEMLTLGTGGAYTSFACGKWHLAADADTMEHPLEQGFQSHAGSAGNIADYFAWEKFVDGVPSATDVYATTDTVDDTIARIAATPEPWFGWVAFHAPHRPFHLPPPSLTGSLELPEPPQDMPVEHARAAVVALDTEIGRLLASIDPEVLARTTVVFLGDNGTDVLATELPFDPAHAKGTTYEGGVNVPLIVTGPHVAFPGTECAGLVGGTDLFATVAEIAGIDLASALPDLVHDSVSFLPYLVDPGTPTLREWLYTESFSPNGSGPHVRLRIGARDARFKWIVEEDVVPVHDVRVELFDLTHDPLEQASFVGGVSAVPTGALQLWQRLQDLRASF